VESFSRDNEAATEGAPTHSELLVFSASTQASLQQQIELHHVYALQHPEVLTDIAYTRAVRRERLPHKAFSIVQSGKVVETSGVVKTSSRSSERPITMIFSGQGAQWVGMGKEQIQTNARFREDIATMDMILQSLKNPPNWTIMSKPYWMSTLSTGV
jgi:acyl transferase domain-containing protein